MIYTSPNNGTDWILAAKETFGTDLTPVQHEILTAIQRTGASVSAVETDGMGRSRLYALICASAVLLNPEIKVVLVSTDAARLNNTLGELHCIIANAFGELGFHHSATAQLSMTVMRLVRDKVDFHYAREGNEEALAGYCDRHSIFILDNADLLPASSLGVLLGGLTEEDNRLLMVSEAYRNEGYFYETLHNPIHEHFHRVRSKSTDTPLVTPSWCEKAAETLPPELYRRRILGEFPLTTIEKTV
jgi:hypothetical protein